MAEAGKNGRPNSPAAVGSSGDLTAEYLATLVHDLRNPLAPIRNATELLRSLCEDPRQLQAVEVISRQVIRLTCMLDDLVEATRAQRNLLSLANQTVDISELVEQVLAAVRPTVDAQRQSLFVSLPTESLQMQCDPKRLAQVLQTLLDNATRHTPQGGSIALKVATQGDQVVAEISDNGAGISSERLPSIFNVFAHGDRAMHLAADRTGINLAIARNIVEMHGGTIAAESAGVGRGSRFTIRLPIAHSEETQTSQAVQAGSYRIVVIDDHEETAKSLADVLANAGHAVVIARNGELGVELAQHFLPDAVVIDIGLPGMDGFEVATALKQQSRTAAAVLIAVSGFSLKQFRDVSAYSVFRHYLLKPVSPESLRHIIESTLEDVGRR